MKIGYACINLSIDAPTSKSCILKNATEKRLRDLIETNLSGLENIIQYNIKKKIGLYRISSGLIPFASHPVNTIKWWDDYKPQLDIIARLIKESGMRVSMHPGQYTVLNSPKPEVVRNAIADLEYHCRILDALTDSKIHKIILHVGGVYGDKNSAVNRFVENYNSLSQCIRDRLVIENDEKSYSAHDVLHVSSLTGAPAVFDNLHNSINPSTYNEYSLIRKFAKTWKACDGIPKMHYSQQDSSKRPGAHSKTIMPDSFFKFTSGLEGLDMDIMLEVKDKNISAEKLIGLMRGDKEQMQREWAKYKYSVMEKSYSAYKEIGNAVAKCPSPSGELFIRINEILSLPEDAGQASNSLEHVWGYFKKAAGDGEREKFRGLLSSYRNEKTPLHLVKEFLRELSVKYDVSYIRDSYY
ncbi:UV-damage endonuclease [Peptoclostridium litorale DSM 5388]|uniref:UV DNA damage endonuclease UvsE n=1 Tax=Peptoclostridium litorale DSM 5388 TaxID=1121324 RepID=A0A069RJC8_PEPLI|nr:UV DNA damage repair endonuclease UvsE [Peptoclostridium litorale]KDR96255.1 UV DNA damage endonuclease UvsE [Peptoclostridium litorale DSM 5388]SIO14573.1 UV-damage endonuclease [Peptoclostridium litorale DSM 5388]